MIKRGVFVDFVRGVTFCALLVYVADPVLVAGGRELVCLPAAAQENVR
jgi:hypothetical protein